MRGASLMEDPLRRVETLARAAEHLGKHVAEVSAGTIAHDARLGMVVSAATGHTNAQGAVVEGVAAKA